MTRLVLAAVCLALAGCAEEKAAAPTSANPSASELFDKKAPPRSKGKAGGG